MQVTDYSAQNKKRVMFVFGTRPEVSKLGPVIFEAKREPLIETLIVSTGQHRDAGPDVKDIRYNSGH